MPTSQGVTLKEGGASASALLALFTILYCFALMRRTFAHWKVEADRGVGACVTLGLGAQKEGWRAQGVGLTELTVLGQLPEERPSQAQRPCPLSTIPTAPQGSPGPAQQGDCTRGRGFPTAPTLSRPSPLLL